jgi:hypothetical protein
MVTAVPDESMYQGIHRPAAMPLTLVIHVAGRGPTHATDRLRDR